MFLKLVCFALAICGATCTDYLGYHGIQDVYQTAYAPHYNNYKPKDYKFEYGVSDPYTGDHKSQWETKENGVVRGAYSLLEPDGTTRIVEYIADDDGFRAVVKKIGHSVHPAAPTIVQPAPLSHITSLYDHSSGVYGGQKENYIAAYRPQPIVYQDNSVHSAVGHGPVDDEVQIYFNDHGDYSEGITGNGDILGYEDYKGEPLHQYVQPEVKYIAPKEQIIAAPVESKVYYEPQHQIVASAPLLNQYAHQEVQHQIPQQYLQQEVKYIASKEPQYIAAPIQHEVKYLAPKEQQIVAAPIQSKVYYEPQQEFVAQAPLLGQYRHQEVQHQVHPQQQIAQQHIQYQPEIRYQGEPIHGHIKAATLQLEPIPYKTLSEYKQNNGQNSGYAYGDY